MASQQERFYAAAKNITSTPPPDASGGLGDVLAFRTLIAADLVRVVFWVVWPAPLALFLMAPPTDERGGNLIIMAVLGFVVWTVAWRVAAECLIVIFNIHDSLRGIEFHTIQKSAIKEVVKP